MSDDLAANDLAAKAANWVPPWQRPAPGQDGAAPDERDGAVAAVQGGGAAGAHDDAGAGDAGDAGVRAEHGGAGGADGVGVGVRAEHDGAEGAPGDGVAGVDAEHEAEDSPRRGSEVETDGGLEDGAADGVTGDVERGAEVGSEGGFEDGSGRGSEVETEGGPEEGAAGGIGGGSGYGSERGADVDAQAAGGAEVPDVEVPHDVEAHDAAADDAVTDGGAGGAEAADATEAGGAVADGGAGLERAPGHESEEELEAAAEARLEEVLEDGANGGAVVAERAAQTEDAEQLEGAAEAGLEQVLEAERAIAGKSADDDEACDDDDSVGDARWQGLSQARWQAVPPQPDARYDAEAGTAGATKATDKATDTGPDNATDKATDKGSDSATDEDAIAAGTTGEAVRPDNQGEITAEAGAKPRAKGGTRTKNRAATAADQAGALVPGQRVAEDLPGMVVPALEEAELIPALEAILMVVDEPVSEITLAQVLDTPAETIAGALIDLSARYTAEGRGFDLRRAAGGWRFYTRADYAPYVGKFVLDGQQLRLTQASLETLAVIAYKQPVTRSRISAIRGVNCDGVVRTLITRGMIEECGTEPESGAHLYRTTNLFLEKLGLDSVEQLPPLAPFLPENLDEVAAGE